MRVSVHMCVWCASIHQGNANRRKALVEWKKKKSAPERGKRDCMSESVRGRNVTG